MKAPATAALARVRDICLALPEAIERPSHGSPNFFAGGRNFLSFLDDHHGDGRLAIWCAAPEGMQRAMLEAAPDRFFVPPYVGFRGWIGLRLDRSPDWEEVAAVIRDAYRAVANRRLREAAGLDTL